MYNVDILTHTPIQAMEKCSEFFCNKSLHGLARCHFVSIGDISFYFNDVR